MRTLLMPTLRKSVTTTRNPLNQQSNLTVPGLSKIGLAKLEGLGIRP